MALRNYGHKQKMPLAVRIYECARRGFVISRDHNSAITIDRADCIEGEERNPMFAGDRNFGEGQAKFWLSVVTELKNRGVEDVLIACVDGLKGFPEAIESIFPRAQVQLCIVHLWRNLLGYVSWKERKPIIYTVTDNGRYSRKPTNIDD